MYDAGEQAFDRDDLFEEVTIANVADFRPVRQGCAIEVVIRHPDLSEGISIGTVYVAGTLGCVLEAVAQGVSAIIRSMEAGVPEARGATLPLADFWDTVSGPRVAKPGVVPSGEKR